jgi:mono/diheme cytochrome c family protein
MFYRVLGAAVLAAGLARIAPAQQPAGPQLMNTQRSDDFIRTRIKIGKEGAMPAFGKSFSDADIDAIIKYIRSLKPQQG